MEFALFADRVIARNLHDQVVRVDDQRALLLRQLARLSIAEESDEPREDFLCNEFIDLQAAPFFMRIPTKSHG